MLQYMRSFSAIIGNLVNIKAFQKLKGALSRTVLLDLIPWSKEPGVERKRTHLGELKKKLQGDL